MRAKRRLSLYVDWLKNMSHLVLGKIIFRFYLITKIHIKCVIFSQQGNTDYALNYTYELMKHYKDMEEEDETIKRLEENRNIYIEDLGGEEAAKEAVVLTKPYKNVPVEQFTHYNELCRGEPVEVKSLLDILFYIL